MTADPHLHYEIRVEGTLDLCWQPHFGRLRLMYYGENTVLAGPVADQAALFGALDRIRDLGLTLVSVRLVEPPTAESQDGRGPSNDVNTQQRDGKQC